MENFNNPIENKLESQPSFVDIKFDPQGNSQKFVEMHDEKDQTYVASYPNDPDHNLHIKILMKAVGNLKEKGVSVSRGGGGTLRLDGNNLFVGGTSKQFGDFDKEKVLETLKTAYPEFEIILQE